MKEGLFCGQTSIHIIPQASFVHAFQRHTVQMYHVIHAVNGFTLNITHNVQAYHLLSVLLKMQPKMHKDSKSEYKVR